MRLPAILVVASLIVCACSARGSGGGTLPVDDVPTVDNPILIDVVLPDVVLPDVVLPDVNPCAGQLESSAIACHDAIDNDCDGMPDCADADCFAFCGRDGGPDVSRDACVTTAPENTNATCSDGIDNDCDGFIDCGTTGTLPDFDCTRTVTVTVCPRDGGVVVDVGCVPTGPENTNAACTDGRDNDCDGFIDCGASGTSPDFDCTRTVTVTVCPQDAGVPHDTAGCIPTGRETGTTGCTDGRDNDCNGFTDCMDRGCSCVGSCGPNRVGCTCRGTESSNLTCTDGLDNDCDGFIDCGAAGTSGDFDCTMNTAVTVCPRDGG